VDWFFDLFAGPRSAVLVRLCSPRHSVGTNRGIRSWVFEHRRADPGVSQIALHLDKLVPLLGPTPQRPTRIHVTEAERHTARTRYGLDAGRDEIFVHPGASWPCRVWPTDRWPRLVSLLEEHRPGCRIHVVTPPGAEALAHDVASRCPGDVTPLPTMGLRDLFSVLSWGRLFVGNDGGVVHAAVALRVPTVALIGGENDPAVWFPYAHLGPYRAIQRVSDRTATGPKGREVGLPDAGPEEVMDAVRALLSF
jgi:ADP-heptose:LPS heptosyltransferase